MAAQTANAGTGALLSEILAYLEWLQKEEKLEITLHGIEPYLHSCLSALLPYNIHGNALCLYAKQSLAVWKQCIACQGKVLDRCRHGPFFGICWVGVSEYVVPIETFQGETVSFICVSGYASNREKSVRHIQRAALEYGLNADEMVNILDRRMRWTLPRDTDVYARVNPLARMLTLLIHKLEKPWKECAAPTNQLFERVVQYLDHYYQRPIVLEELSAQFNCSPSYMSRLVNRCGGVSLKQYINDRRIRTAKVFLENSSMSVQEIAYAVGFSDPNYFSTVFRHACGFTPRDWRHAANDPKKEAER